VLELLGRKTWRRKRKSVVTMKKNAAVAKNENAVIDNLQSFSARLFGYICTDVGHYTDRYSLFFMVFHACIGLNVLHNIPQSLTCTVLG